ncbi:MAG: peptidylprolyl isomerase [Gammaproteobacteria bacterium]|nr:peptidylprolyl isomerase [Gammaproteobacteria bacterium]
MQKLKYLIAIPLLLLSTYVISAEEETKSPANPQVLLETSAGEITLELYPEKAPKSVANFLNYVEDGFYNNTIFHRVIDDFMIQGGGFTTDYKKKSTYAPIMNEADNRLRNTVGTIAMARTSDPHSATAQFFINVKNNSFLDFREKRVRAWGYAVFGRVIKGMDVVAKIKGTPTGAGGPFGQNVPKTQIVINKVTLITAKDSGEKTND